MTTNSELLFLPKSKSKFNELTCEVAMHGGSILIKRMRTNKEV